MKKLLTLVLVVTMGMLLLVGCKQGSNDKTTDTSGEQSKVTNEPTKEPTKEAEQPKAEEQILKVAAFEGGYGADMWREVVAAFEASHPGVKVELTIDKKIEDVISPSMKAGDYPDVVHLATGREAALTETLTKEKALLPLTDVLEMTVPGETAKVKEKIVGGFIDTLSTNP